jgi:hypothetical protein
LANVGAIGTYNQVVTDYAGRVVSGTFAAPGTAIVTGDVSGPVVKGSTTTLTLATVATAGTYSQVVVTAKGLVTAGTLLSNTIVDVGDVTGSGVIGGTTTLTLASVGTAGTYSQVVTDAKGRVISGTVLPISITDVGDVSGVGSLGGTTTLTLATVGSVGTYNQVITDAKGRVVSGTFTVLNGTAAVTGDVSGNTVLGTTTTLTLATIGSVGTYQSVVVNAKGLVTSGTSIGAFTGAGSTTAGSIGLVPAPAAGQNNYVLYGSGSWAAATGATFTGAGSLTAGTAGTVPAPAAGQQNYMLTGAATFQPAVRIASGYGPLGTVVTLGNLKARYPTSGNASLQLATVTGSVTLYGTAVYATTADGGTPTTVSLGSTGGLFNTTFAYFYSSQNDIYGSCVTTWMLFDATNGNIYRIISVSGPGPATNNAISIEQLL